ncbi:MAG: D-tyrosyl-tRNA(Tyr) deacylase [Myxococcales bacterium]|nr:D-tyrosyl-tRNA(Tyr) deacylase [Myxococcales bacterium]
MRAVIQRVSHASVTVDGEVVGRIGKGFLALIGAAQGDEDADVEYIASKIAGLRIFEDDGGKMNLALADVGGAVLAVSQFTLFGDCRKGRRPSFTGAMEPGQAAERFESVVARLRALGLPVETGRFRAHMDVSLLNDGPVTLLIDSRKDF